MSAHNNAARIVNDHANQDAPEHNVAGATVDQAARPEVEEVVKETVVETTEEVRPGVVTRSVNYIKEHPVKFAVKVGAGAAVGAAVGAGAYYGVNKIMDKKADRIAAESTNGINSVPSVNDAAAAGVVAGTALAAGATISKLGFFKTIARAFG